jgi:hypothetical protein
MAGNIVQHWEINIDGDLATINYSINLPMKPLPNLLGRWNGKAASEVIWSIHTIF